MRFFRSLCLLLSVCAGAQAQWQILDAHATADFRGVHYVGNGVAWVSGTNGTVLRTEDMGKTWTHCAVPAGAEKLDFRGVQAFDAKTAIVMSSGPGDASRVYKTVDGCATWKLVFTNPDAEGFWDAIQFAKPYDTDDPDQRMSSEGILVGDPVQGRFVIYRSVDSGDSWSRWGSAKGQHSARAAKSESVFAASNSAITFSGAFNGLRFVTGGDGGSRIFFEKYHDELDGLFTWVYFEKKRLYIPSSASSGAFSIARRIDKKHDWPFKNLVSVGNVYVIVGGDYEHPDHAGVAVHFYEDPNAAIHPEMWWVSAKIPPHGYRSAVAYDEKLNAWITVGPNGTDVSFDDGRIWLAVRPSADDVPDADKVWNALSLPFVVGPKGRIGLLREGALAGLATGKKTPRR